MRILFVNRMAGMQRGGGETFDLEMAAQLARMGHEVTFLTGRPVFRQTEPIIQHPSSNIEHSTLNNQERRTRDQEPTVRNAVSFHFLRSPYLPWFPWDGITGGWKVRVWEFQLFEKRAASWIRKHADEFDIIQICELPYLVSLLKSAIGNRRSAIVMRLTAPNAYDAWNGIQQADALIASGTSIAKIRESVRSDVFDVPNGVDLARFGESIGDGRWAMGDGQGGIGDGQLAMGHESLSPEDREIDLKNEDVLPTSIAHRPSSIRDRFNIPASVPLLLYVARFQKFKNHSLLIDAFARLLKDEPEARLVLVGSGPLIRELEVRCQRSEVRGRVMFLGETPFEDLPGIYAAAGVKVISSEYESFCFAAIEAMASGLPVVTTDCGWVPGLIGDSREPVHYQWADEREDPARYADMEKGRHFLKVPGGLVVMRGDPESFANAMLKMIRNPGLRDACGAWNREKAFREHGWESSAKKLLEVYGGLRG